MRTERLPVDTVALVLLGACLLVVGWAIAPALFEALVRDAGSTQVVYTSADEPLLLRLELALAVASPAPLAWVLGLVRRGVGPTTPSALWLGGVTLALVLAFVAGAAWEVAWLRGALAEVRQGGLLGMFDVASFDVAGPATRRTLYAALAIGIATWLRARGDKPRA